MKQYITPHVEVLRLGTTTSIISTSYETLRYKDNNGDYMIASQENAW